MTDKRITGGDDARASRSDAAPRDERLDRLVTALAEARPVLDDVTRARVGAKLAATTRKWSVGSAVRPDAGRTASAAGGPPDVATPPPVIARPAPPTRRRAWLVLVVVLVLLLAVAIALRARCAS